MIKDLPVGQKNFDHINTFLFFKAHNVTTPSKPTDGTDAIYNMIFHRTGSFVNMISVASFKSTTNEKYADHEAIYFVLGKVSPNLAGLTRYLGLNHHALKHVFNFNEQHDIF